MAIEASTGITSNGENSAGRANTMASSPKAKKPTARCAVGAILRMTDVSGSGATRPYSHWAHWRLQSASDHPQSDLTFARRTGYRRHIMAMGSLVVVIGSALVRNQA